MPYNFGYYYQTLRTPQHRDAIHAYEKSMRADGDARAYYMRAVYYEEGLGNTTQNTNKAKELYIAAADAGCPDAQFAVGYRYETGTCGFEPEKVDQKKR